MARKRRRSRRRGREGRVGRLFEGMAVLVLLLIVLTFGISIASRFLPESETIEVRNPPGRSETVPPPSSSFRRNAQLEVQNGCGRDGLARRIGLELRESDFDVLEWKDAKSYDHEVTTVRASEPFRPAGVEVLAYLQQNYDVGVLELGEIPGGVADVLVILGRDLDDALEGRSDP